MMSKLLNWITRKQQERHGTEWTERRARESLGRMEAIVRQQERDAIRVNAIYDRIAPPRKEQPQ